MEDFLKREGQKGKLIRGGTVYAPPNGRVNWDSAENLPDLWQYIRTVGRIPDDWNTNTCLLAFPASKDPPSEKNGGEESPSLMDIFSNIWEGRDGRKPPHPVHFQGRPVAVNAPAIERMREALAERKRLCLYDDSMQHERVIHIPLNADGKSQIFTHFYSFVFFEDWKHDLWAKRMVSMHP